MIRVLDWTERALGSTWLPPMAAGALAYRSGIGLIDIILAMVIFVNIMVKIEQIDARTREQVPA